MWYIVIIGLIAVGIFFSSKITFKTPYNRSGKNDINTINPPLNQNDTIKAMFSKKQIDLKLKRLAETPAPEKLAFGAECYEISYRDYSVHEYFCPKCSEKTIYKKDKNPNKSFLIETLENNLGACRNELQKVKGINIKLDEIEFCAHCSPNIKEPRMYLLVNIAGQNDTTKLTDFSYMDIRLIQEFLDDKLVHQDDQDFESPLKDNILRIKELLGLK